MIERVFFIEGIIGAGKTTQGKFICDNVKNAVWIEEPVQDWIDAGILGEFYKDMKGNAFKFQSFILTTRIKKINDIVKNLDPSGSYILFIERSIFSDRHFFVKNLIQEDMFSEIEQKMYDTTFDLYLNSLLPFKTYEFIYLRPNIDETMKRIKKRNRDKETVPEDYQRKLLTLHDEFFSDYTDTEIERLKKGKNFFVINGNEFVTMDVIEKILKTCHIA